MHRVDHNIFSYIYFYLVIVVLVYRNPQFAVKIPAINFRSMAMSQATLNP
jgi:hypothetical protein